MNPADVEDAAREVLAFWFEELAPAQWWKVDPALDDPLGQGAERGEGRQHAAQIVRPAQAFLAVEARRMGRPRRRGRLLERACKRRLDRHQYCP